LEAHTSTRANILSYNTEVGLPLSILNLKSPRSLHESFVFGLQFLRQLLLPKDRPQILVLEYGINSRQDAERLLRIAVPDWLIITALRSADPAMDYGSIQAGILEMLRRVPADRVIWPADDELLQDLDLKLLPHNSLSSAELPQHNREAVGQSAQRALAASLLMAQKLEIPKDVIEAFLS